MSLPRSETIPHHAEIAALTDCMEPEDLAGYVLVAVHRSGRIHVISNCRTPRAEARVLRDAIACIDGDGIREEGD